VSGGKFRKIVHADRRRLETQMAQKKNQRKSARENSEKRFHANVRRLKTQMDADKKISVDLRERKDGFTQIGADVERRYSQIKTQRGAENKFA
jgi:hypothetical protein